MSLHVAMPWFFPLATGVAYACSQVALRLHRGEGRKTWQALLMLALGWYPVLMWIVAQFVSKSPR